MFHDGARFDLEPARAGNADSGHSALMRLLGAFARWLAGTKTPSDVGNGHVGMYERSSFASNLDRLSGAPAERVRAPAGAHDVRSGMLS